MTSAPENGGAAHRIEVRVYYEDTDLAGVVYHANYLRFMERARTEWLRALGVDQSALKRDSGRVFVVRRCEIDFARPALMDDRLIVATEVAAMRGASVDLIQAISRAEEGPAAARLVSGRFRIACLDASGRPTRLPEALSAPTSPSDSDRGCGQSSDP